MNNIVRHPTSSHALKGQTVLLILPIHLQGMEREVEICPIVVGVQGPPMDGDDVHTYTQTLSALSQQTPSVLHSFL